jgi:hypothetical protein
LGKAAENVGRRLGQVANRLDRLHIQRDAISAEMHRLAHSASEMLARVRAGARTEVAVVESAVQRGRKAGFKMSAEARRKMSIAAKKRHAAAKKAAGAKG